MILPPIFIKLFLPHGWCILEGLGLHDTFHICRPSILRSDDTTWGADHTVGAYNLFNFLIKNVLEKFVSYNLVKNLKWKVFCFCISLNEKWVLSSWVSDNFEGMFVVIYNYMSPQIFYICFSGHEQLWFSIISKQPMLLPKSVSLFWR